jgi:hypothetical protein
MFSYWFQYDINGFIYPLLQENTPNTTMKLLGPYQQGTATPEIIMAYTYPNRYLVISGNLVEQPYFTLTTAQNGNQYTITATINNPGSPPPASTSFNVAGSDIVVPVINTQAVLTLNLHPSIAHEMINIAVSASGCMGTQIQIGGSDQSIGLQVYVPSGGVQTIAPSGSGSQEYLETYYATQIPLQFNVINNGVGVSLALDMLARLVLPALIKNGSISLGSDDQSGLNDLTSNLLPQLYTTLSNAHPNGGSAQPEYMGIIQGFEGSKQLFSAFNADLQSIPNLDW